jgi:hypothetical protein
MKQAFIRFIEFCDTTNERNMEKFKYLLTVPEILQELTLSKVVQMNHIAIRDLLRNGYEIIGRTENGKNVLELYDEFVLPNQPIARETYPGKYRGHAYRVLKHFYNGGDPNAEIK